MGTLQNHTIKVKEPPCWREHTTQFNSGNSFAFSCRCYFLLHIQIQYWKTEEGIGTMRNHTIKVKEPPPCWRERGRQERELVLPFHADANSEQRSGHKRTLKTYSAQLFNLPPYTNITAHIRVLNVKYEGPPSSRVFFRTKEGGTYFNSYFIFVIFYLLLNQPGFLVLFINHISINFFYQLIIIGYD